MHTNKTAQYTYTQKLKRKVTDKYLKFTLIFIRLQNRNHMARLNT